MRPIRHLIASSAVAGVFYIYYKSPIDSIICFLSGMAIDVDHIFDYYVQYKSFKNGIKHFYEVCDRTLYDRLYLFFHSFELLLVLWVLVIIFPRNLLLFAVVIGVTQHMILDQAWNRMTRYLNKNFYFLIYRLRKNFKKELMLQDEVK